jgi:hypothetical protein
MCGLNGSLYCSLLLWLCLAWTVHCTARYYSDYVWLERFIVLLVTTMIAQATHHQSSNEQYNEPFKQHIIRAVTSSTMNRSSHTPSEQVCALNGSLYCSLLLWLCVAWTVHCTARYCSDGVWLERAVQWTVQVTHNQSNNEQYNEPFKSHTIRAVTNSTMNRSSRTQSEQ